MNKLFFTVLASTVLLFASCSKSKDECAYSDLAITATASEIAAIQTYLTNNTLTATQHTSGLFFKVNAAGSGSTPGLCSIVTVRYTGKFMSNGVIFETSPATGVQFQLGQLIPGWQKGIPLIQKGGRITLYLPPSLAYGAQDVRDNTGAIIIPANSTLIFDIELLDVQ